MIRFPKKNIAQRQTERKQSKEKQIKKEPDTEEPKQPPSKIEPVHNALTEADPDKIPINIPEVPVGKNAPLGVPVAPPIPVRKPVKYEEELDEEDVICYGKYGGKLYPEKLWQLHYDIDTWAYHRDKLSEEELAKLEARMPGSMLVAESTADRMLSKFVENSINNVGPEMYTQVLKVAMTDMSQILLALRCFIAASTDQRPREKITIYQNKSMSAKDFFPKDCQRTYVDPKTKQEMTYYVDRPEGEDNVYWRSESHESRQHKVAQQLLEPPPSKKDQLPSDYRGYMQFLLKEYGLDVETVEDAWRFLDTMGRSAEIEDRILSRIAYLIVNAQVQRRTFNLPDKKYLG